MWDEDRESDAYPRGWFESFVDCLPILSWGEVVLVVVMIAIEGGAVWLFLRAMEIARRSP